MRIKGIIRVCRQVRCKKRFECYGDCGMQHRINAVDYCTCPECVAKDGGHSWHMRMVRRGEKPKEPWSVS